MSSFSVPQDQASIESFETIYAVWLDFVWLLLRRLGVRAADLEDATQEVFMVVHRRLDEYDRSRPFRPWLGGIAFRVALRERRRPRHAREAPASSDDLSDLAGADGGPEQALMDAQRRVRLLSALDDLSDERRAVFVMHELHEMPMPEVAAALEGPVNTAYTRLRAARAEVKATLSRLRLTGGEL